MIGMIGDEYREEVVVVVAGRAGRIPLVVENAVAAVVAACVQRPAVPEHRRKEHAQTYASPVGTIDCLGDLRHFGYHERER